MWMIPGKVWSCCCSSSSSILHNMSQEITFRSHPQSVLFISLVDLPVTETCRYNFRIESIVNEMVANSAFRTFHSAIVALMKGVINRRKVPSKAKDNPSAVLFSISSIALTSWYLLIIGILPFDLFFGVYTSRAYLLRKYT